MKPLPLFTHLLLIGTILLWYACSDKKMPPTVDGSWERAASYYAEYCASCHGENAAEFVNRETWVLGESRAEMFEAIHDGLEVHGMPAYGEVLSDNHIYELVDYIQAAIAHGVPPEPPTGTPLEEVYESAGMSFRLELVGENVGAPWGLAQAEEGTFFYTNKSGVLWAKDGDNERRQIQGVPEVAYTGQGGLLDVVLHPNFTTNKRIYLSYSKPNPNNSNENTTAIFSGILSNGVIENGADIFVAQPYVNSSLHFGSRMVFDNDGYLYLCVGERGRRDDFPQALDNHLGKVLRLKDDGTVPSDNPFVDTPGALPEIYSYGHRNPQGMAYDAAHDRLYVNEHGPRGGDEINLIEAGNNYGWPVITYGINYNGTTITDQTHQAGMEQPLRYWTPSIASCGMAFVDSPRYPAWQGNLLSGSLKFDYIHRDIIDEAGNWQDDEKLLEGIGRLRSITQGTDGYIYFGIEDPGKIFRIVPVE